VGTAASSRSSCLLPDPHSTSSGRSVWKLCYDYGSGMKKSHRYLVGARLPTELCAKNQRLMYRQKLILVIFQLKTGLSHI
jgi:hypothetical protein